MGGREELRKTASKNEREREGLRGRGREAVRHTSTAAVDDHSKYHALSRNIPWSKL